ncbi:ATP-binding protein [Sphaerisporangium corydalis]|uniref:ATP-binding protein n=1 Tax=Sphaerisporangium corydalis TaxID=1441875 RepID=A0ABV9EH73_9ACTN|nr:LuxR C-terminal-related transcriptional regulator [Sphaerisporangium corydalis]
MASSTPKRRRVLPAEVTSFVGRRREVAEVKTLLSRSRLVTLTGAGGVGKTRLAARVASDVRRAFPDGVWPVELAPLDDPDLLPQTLMEVLGLRQDLTRSPMESVIDHLTGKKALLVLDNSEHLLHACAVLAEELLASLPELWIIVTSRQPLRIGGEQTLAVMPLAVPGTDAARLSTDALAHVDAVRLFVERAEAVLPGFTITDENRDAVERICRRLDGLPLAIELAAVRLRALSVQQLLDRLDDRFRLLTAGSRVVSQRHQTLRALIDWSYDLCTGPERLLWARASVFRGGLDLEAAEGVCSGDGIEREDVIDLVIGLVEKSVLVREDHPQGVRYRLLETIRQYGGDRLAESGQERDLWRRHREYYRDLAAQARAQLFTGSQVRWLERLRLDHGNLRVALKSSFDCGEPEEGLRAAIDLLYHWRTGHHSDEGRHWVGHGLHVVTEPSELRARALWGDAWMAILEGEIEYAVSRLEECRVLAERLGLDSVLAYVALFSGMVDLYQGDTKPAIKLFEEALAAHRACGDETGEVLALTRLCLAHSFEGDSDRAVAAGEEALRICDARGEEWHRSYAIMALGIDAWRRGDVVRAGDLAKESLRFDGTLRDRPGMGVNVAVLAWITASEGQYERAARLLGILRGVWRTDGAPMSGFGHLVAYHDECEFRMHQALGEPGFKAEVQRGARLSEEDALAFALEIGTSAADCSPGVVRTSPLTRREGEIARLVAQGLSNKEIAAALVIAQRTAEGHIEHILSKLGFHSRAQIAVWVAEQARGAEGRQGADGQEAAPPAGEPEGPPPGGRAPEGERRG